MAASLGHPWPPRHLGSCPTKMPKMQEQIFGRLRHLLPPAGERSDCTMTDPGTDRIEINGAPASVEDLRLLVQTNYGHFSAMQVVDGGVRGLDLHLERIERATRELFGSTIDRERVRACLRHAVGGSRTPLSLR